MTRSAYGLAYEQGFRRTVRMLQSRGASADIAEDFAQAAWLRGWQMLHQLRDDQMVTGWVNTIALNFHRRGCHEQTRFELLTDRSAVAHLDLTGLDAARALTFCRPSERTLFERQLQGMSTIEIARQEGVTPTAMRIRLFRARRTVRTGMEDRASARRAALIA